MRTEAVNNLPILPTSRNPEIKKQVLIDYTEIPNLLGLSKAIFLPGQTDPSHAHPDSYEIILVDHGTGNITIEDKVYPLRPGIFMIIEPKEIHEVTNDSSEELTLTCLGIKSPD